MKKKLLKIMNFFIIYWVFLNLLLFPITAFSFSKNYFTNTEFIDKKDTISTGLFGKVSKDDTPTKNTSNDDTGDSIARTGANLIGVAVDARDTVQLPAGWD